MSEPATKRTYHLYTYDYIWAEMKKKLNFTDEQLRKQVQSALQMNAWGDVMDGMEGYVEYVEKRKTMSAQEIMDQLGEPKK